MRVIDKLPHLDRKDGVFGIEIEAEGANLEIPRNPYWKMEQDGSLRNNPECCEYVFKLPMSFADSMLAIDYLNDQHKANGAILNWSYRCSTHVHVNMLEEEITTVLRLAYIYYIFENLLVKWSGNEREGNRFCLRLQDSYEISQTIANTFSQPLEHIDENRIRYAALNLASLRKYGSVEFRSLSGTTDKVRLEKWLTMLHSLLEAARIEQSVSDIFFNSREDLNSYGKKVFGEALFNELYYAGWEHDAKFNLSLNINLINLYKDVVDEEARVRELQQRKPKPKKAEEPIAVQAPEEPWLEVQAPRQARDDQLGQIDPAREFDRDIFERLRGNQVRFMQAGVLPEALPVEPDAPVRKVPRRRPRPANPV